VISCEQCGAVNRSIEVKCTSCGTALETAAVRALIGQLALGVYRITDVLGQGGMSVVYKAVHRMTDQVVALKILPPELAALADLKVRFLEEAKALAKLEHPNIVRLYHFGEEQGRFVLAMQYVEGTTFENLILRAGELPWRQALGVGCEVLRALDYAHRRGVVHRDIKPSNVLVRPDGSAMVMDFGIAKMAQGSTRLTATGQTMGTVRYMSPEQVRGQVVDARTDLYSLGCTLFEALTGETPFDGTTHFDIMMKHISEPPPSPRSRGADVPESVDRAMLRSLAKDLGQRYQTAAELLAVLEAALAAPEAPAELPVDVGDAAAAILGAGAHRETTPLAGPPTEETALGGLAEVLEPDLPETHARGGVRAEVGVRVAPPALASATREEAVPDAELASLRTVRRTWPWAVLGGGMVLVAAAAVLLLARGRDTGARAADRSAAPGATPAATAPAASSTPVATAASEGPGAPLLPPGVAFPVDRTFEDLRVLGPAGTDADAVARSYSEARQRFTAWVEKQGLSVEAHPLTLVVAPPDMMCTAALYPRREVPRDCATKPPRFLYPPRSATLYVRAGEHFETVNLVEGVSAHLCIGTPALLERRCMSAFLPPYWDEIEGSVKR
jgi:predicted Ser/Thr protein kinase